LDNSDAADQVLVESWNGSSWSNDTNVQDENPASPPGATSFNKLTGVSCGSASDCWAVGSYRPDGFELPMAEHWTGSGWAISELPQFGGTPDGSYVLDSISCPDTSDCMAAGYWEPTGSGSTWHVLLDQWTSGGGWQILSSVDGNAGILYGITCVDADHCYAVGADTSADPETNLVESWDGTSWSVVPSIPDNGSGENGLYGVSCVSTSYCWAVGYYEATEGSDSQNLFLQWDGHSWSIPTDTSAANYDLPGENTNFLDDVACTGESSCWAVGAYETSGSAEETVIDGWNGSSWTLVANTPNGNATEENELDGVACGDSSDCAAVGDFAPPDPTLILMYSAPASAPVPASGAPATGGMIGLAAIGAGLLALLAVSGAAVLERRRLARR